MNQIFRILATTIALVCFFLSLLAGAPVAISMLALGVHLLAG